MNQPVKVSRLLLPLGLAASLSLFGDLALYAGLVTQLDLVGLTLAQTGVLLSVHRLLRIPGNPIVGLLYDRFSRRRLFLTGMVLAVISSLAYGVVSGFWPWLLARLAWGSAWALINVGAMMMILEASPAGIRGRMVGLYNTWIWVGYAGGPLVGGLLVDLAGFRTAMLGCAVVSLAGLAVAALFLPETAAAGREETRGGARTQLINLWTNLRGTLTASPQAAAALALYALTIFAGDGIFLSTVTLLLNERLGEQIPLFGLAVGAASAGGALIAVRSLLGGVIAPLAGHLTDRRGERRLVIAAGMALGAASFAVIALAGSFWSVLAGTAISAVSGGAAMAAIPAYLGDHLPPGKSGTAVGAMATAGDIGSTIGPALAFAAAPVFGLRAIYLFSALLMLAGLGLLAQTAAGRAGAALRR